MVIITGTALSKHTPLRVLQELAQGERWEAEREERMRLAPPADAQKEFSQPQERTETDSVNLASE